MSEKPVLHKALDPEIFRDFYYLKEELVAFCREEGLPLSGGKQEITERIVRYLETGEKIDSYHRKKKRKESGEPSIITNDSLIEENLTCSERHRAFFRESIGKSFRFNVAFQNWLKANSGKTYGEAVEAYYRIQNEKKTQKTTIGKQFEYNSYIRDFFEDNKGKQLPDAIRCWKYKKSLPGFNRYEKSDLKILEKTELSLN